MLVAECQSCGHMAITNKNTNTKYKYKYKIQIQIQTQNSQKKSVIRTANQDDITFLRGHSIKCIVGFTEEVFVFRKKFNKKINSMNRKSSQLHCM